MEIIKIVMMQKEKARDLTFGGRGISSILDQNNL
jgi:hypothetical protein